MSSDDSVAAVDGDGHITGVTTITVSSAAGKVTGSTEVKVAITPSSGDAP